MLQSRPPAGAPAAETAEGPRLERSISLPMLVFYGVGVTVGAGIFALVGEILDVAGDQAPLALLTAGVVAGFTGVSYMLLVREFPRAGGEAVYASRGLGASAGRIAGLGVVVTGTISSAVVSLAFGGYVAELVSIPEELSAVILVVLLALVASWGIRESVALAAIITTLEVGALIVVIAFGLPDFAAADELAKSFDPSGSMSPVLAGAVIAFFAFIGFEDIANMAEETIDPRRTAPRAVAYTLGITMVVYLLLALLAVSLPDRAAITESDAPMSEIFEMVSGFDGAPIATIASFAMLNGILVQMVMASRVLYGMASDGQIHKSFAAVHPKYHTPAFATAVVASVVILLALLFPLVRLARVTSIVTLTVFTLVNLALYRIGASRPGTSMHRWRWNGLIGATVAAGLAIYDILPFDVA